MIEKQLVEKTFKDVLVEIRITLELRRVFNDTIKESEFKEIISKAQDKVSKGLSENIISQIKTLIDDWTLDVIVMSSDKDQENDNDKLSLDNMIKMSGYPGNNYSEDHGTAKVKRGYFDSRNSADDDSK